MRHRGGVAVGDGALHGECGTHGALGIVLVRDRRTEQREDRVADDLVDLAAVGGDVGDESLERVVDDVLHLLGIAGLRQAGEADEIGEEHGDDAAFVRTALHRRAAGRAEACTLHQRGPARRARHDTESTGACGCDLLLTLRELSGMTLSRIRVDPPLSRFRPCS